MPDLRCIYAVPDLEPASPASAVDRLREVYDPLWGKVPAHVTLVFPFELPVAGDAIATHLNAVCTTFPAWEITFDCGRIGGDRYAYLPVLSGAAALRDMYERLHTGVLRKALEQQRFKAPFRPHLTVGRIKSEEEAGQMARAMAGVHRNLRGRIRTIVLETILSDERSQVDYVLQLEQ